MKTKGDEKRDEDEQPIVSWCSKFYKDLRHSSAAKQLSVGAIGGWVSGFVFTKFGKIAATGVGITVLVLHYAHHNGYVQVNWKRVNSDVEKAKKELGKRAEKELPELLDKTQAFVVENVLLAGGFAGGFCLGVASAAVVAARVQSMRMQSSDPQVVVLNGDISQVNKAFDGSSEEVHHIDINTKDSNGWSQLSNGFGSLGTVLSSLENERMNIETEDETLVHTAVQVIPAMHFYEEIRGNLEFKHNLDDISVILDVQAENMQQIVDLFVEQVTSQQVNVTALAEEIKSVIFADEKNILLSDTIQGISYNSQGNDIFDQSWISVLCKVANLKQRKVGLVRLKESMNLGRSAERVKFVLLILVPVKEKATKNSYEIGRIFGTLFGDQLFRNELTDAKDAVDVKNVIANKVDQLSKRPKTDTKKAVQEPICRLGVGLWENFQRRLKFYCSDFVDGICGNKTIHKTIATVFFLYFSCLLPCIAFGVLNAGHTNNKIDAGRALVGQAIGGLAFALFGGQPLVIIATTALVSLYIEVVQKFSDELQVDFYAMYASVGLWNSLFVLLYSVFGISGLIKWSTRSVEEIFAMFIFVCFVLDAAKDVIKSFMSNYFSQECLRHQLELVNATESTQVNHCLRESSLLYLILMLGTVWLSVTIYEFNKTPYLSAKVREFLSDYALPIGVVAFSFLGSFVFKDIKLEGFEFSVNFDFKRASVETLNWEAMLTSCGLGFALSLLFFMDQNISGQIVNSPSNKLKKGSTPHLDLFVIAIINAFLSLYGLPWMHGILPHSPLHVRSLADVKEQLDQGYVREVIVRVRETRLTGILCHILIGLSLFMVPYPLAYIPVPVLDGLFLYCAVASLRGNSMFERFLLLFTEQNSYPPNHYIRRCPQRRIHVFTILEIIQLCALCFVGFSPWTYVQMAFPLAIAMLIPIRHLIIPLMVGDKHVKALDTYH